MKIIYNRIIPFKGFIAINIFGVLFVRKEYKDKINEFVLNHERIHTAQMKETLYILFYIMYFIEWIIRLFISNKGGAYKNISFEREAYSNEGNLNYLEDRELFSFLKYMNMSNIKNVISKTSKICQKRHL